MTAVRSATARPFGTVGTAMVTPFTPDGAALDLDAAVRVATHLVDGGTDQLVLNGTTGESPTTTDEEKIALVRAVREALPDEVVLLAGVGSYDTRHSVELARRHADLGLDGLLVVTPYYGKPAQDGILRHLTAVADATDLPVMLYDIPGRTGIPLATDTLFRLGEHERILAVKDAKADFAQATLVMEGTGLAYYSGEDALNLPWLSVGAAGLVSVVGHAAPGLERDLVRAVDDGDLPRAQRIHRSLAPLVEAVMGQVPGVVAAKTALELQGVLEHATVRGPHVAATPPQARRIAEALTATPGIPPVIASSRRTS